MQPRNLPRTRARPISLFRILSYFITGIAVGMAFMAVLLGMMPAPPVPIVRRKEKPKDFFYSECDPEGNLLNCTRQICDDIGTYPSLNRAETEFYRIINGEVQLTASTSEEDPNGLHSKIAREIIRASRQPVESAIHSDAEGITERLHGAPVALGNFLMQMVYLARHSVVPDCSGKASQVAIRLVNQPLIQETGATIETVELLAKSKSGESFPHAISRVKTPSGDTILCDAWLPGRRGEPSQVCVEGSSPSEDTACQIYKALYWTQQKVVSLPSPVPGYHSATRDIQDQTKKEIQTLNRIVVENAKLMKQSRDMLKAIWEGRGKKQAEEHIEQSPGANNKRKPARK